VSSLIRLDELGIPRRGWPGRRRAIARLVLQMIGMLVILVGLFVVAYLYLWLLAPEGAAYPR
jgi:cell division septal protein FtsQ